MRNPNGYGSVVKLSGNRRNPYVVRKTTGWSDLGYPVYNVIGYCSTREAGMIVLAAYNANPYDIDKSKTTLEDLFKLWDETKGPKLKAANRGKLKSAYKHCSKLYKKIYKDIRSYHMQEVIDNCGKSYSTQGAIKSLFKHLDDFALETDVINKSYAQLTTSEPIPPSNKIPFTDDEVNALWKIKDEPWVDSVLVFLYSGWRISELLGLKITDVDLDAGTMAGGVKTEAGKNRIVPIHSKILDLVTARYNGSNEYLFEFEKHRVADHQYRAIWKDVMTRLNMEHNPHECRHTFRSRLDSAGANSAAINKIMGHAGKDVGERVYTHKSIDELRTAIEMITN